ncbi:ABC transporter substrate-binding protein, partial [Frankia sp. EI5c]|uniref:ABC transporter substrate-binding protein n=1 Tax=Frankia sp. EI5c TaxID=683316 RepID=UPI001F5B413A
MTSLSACQGDSEQAAAACDSPGVTAREVRAGLLYPDSGLGADIFTPLRAGVDARFGAENAAGGVHGRRLAYEWRNDEARADVNLAISEKLVQSGQVFGIIEASVVTSGGAAYLAEAGVPVVGLAVEKTWTSYRNMFTFAYNFTGDGTVDTF